MRPPRWSLRRARALVGTKFLLIAALLGFVVLVWLVELVAGISGPVQLGRLPALALAAVPAVLWLAFFYLQDRHEPEPKHYAVVVGVSVLGALAAAPLASFLVSQASPPVALGTEGLSPFSLDRVLHAVAVVGLAQELCKYAAVRYTVYMSREFDEPMDGVVFMMSVGTGFAVWENYHRLLDQGHTAILSVGVAKAVITTLAHASFAGVLGYVMGRTKFSRRSAPVRGVFLMLGLMGAAVLNGQFWLVEQWVSKSGLESQPWKGVGYAALLAMLVFAAVSLASRRLLRASAQRRTSEGLAAG